MQKQVEMSRTGRSLHSFVESLCSIQGDFPEKEQSEQMVGALGREECWHLLNISWIFCCNFHSANKQKIRDFKKKY